MGDVWARYCRDTLIHSLRGNRLVVFELILQVVSLLYLLFVVVDVVHGSLETLIDESWWRPIVAPVDVACLGTFALGLCINIIIEGKSMLTCSDMTISLAHNGTFVVANLAMAVIVLASLPNPSVELVNMSRYTKLVGAYSRVVGNFRSMWIHLKRIRSMLKLQADQAPLRFKEGLARIRLQPPANKGGHHVFISHCWRYAQDTAGTVNGRLLSLDCGIRTFLDVNDLDDIAHLEQHVDRSDLVLVVLTEQYITSVNCRRELTASYVARKPIVVLVESDIEKGATSSTGLRAELEAIERNGRLAKEERKAVMHLIGLVEQREGGNMEGMAIPQVVEWHREIEFKKVVYKVVVANTLNAQHDHISRTQTNRVNSGKVASLQELCFVDEAEDVLEAKSWEGTRRRLLYLSPHYKDVLIDGEGDSKVSVFELLQRKFRTVHVELVDRPQVPAARVMLGRHTTNQSNQSSSGSGGSSSTGGFTPADCIGHSPVMEAMLNQPTSQQQAHAPAANSNGSERESGVSGVFRRMSFINTGFSHQLELPGMHRGESRTEGESTSVPDVPMVSVPKVVFLCPALFEHVALADDSEPKFKHQALIDELLVGTKKHRLQLKSRGQSRGRSLAVHASDMVKLQRACQSFNDSPARSTSRSQLFRGESLKGLGARANLPADHPKPISSDRLSFQDRLSEVELVEPPPDDMLLLGLYSTSKLFSFYMSAAPPSLKAQGFFDLFFVKFPTDPVLQEPILAKIAKQGLGTSKAATAPNRSSSMRSSATRIPFFPRLSRNEIKVAPAHNELIPVEYGGGGGGGRGGDGPVNSGAGVQWIRDEGRVSSS